MKELLKYEHPMMVISKTKNIFLKKIKKMKKMIASDCSLQCSYTHKGRNSSHMLVIILVLLDRILVQEMHYPGNRTKTDSPKF